MRWAAVWKRWITDSALDKKKFVQLQRNQLYSFSILKIYSLANWLSAVHNAKKGECVQKVGGILFATYLSLFSSTKILDSVLCSL